MIKDRRKGRYEGPSHIVEGVVGGEVKDLIDHVDGGRIAEEYGI